MVNPEFDDKNVMKEPESLLKKIKFPYLPSRPGKNCVVQSRSSKKRAYFEYLTCCQLFRQYSVYTR